MTFDPKAVMERWRKADPGNGPDGWIVDHRFDASGHEYEQTVVTTGGINAKTICESETYDEADYFGGGAEHENNFEFIAHAYNDVRAALDEIERLRARVAELEGALRPFADAVGASDVSSVGGMRWAPRAYINDDYIRAAAAALRKPEGGV